MDEDPGLHGEHAEAFEQSEDHERDTFAESDAIIDEALAAGDPHSPPGSRPIDRFHRTAAGSVLAAGMLGLRDALEGRPEKEEPAIVAEAPGKRHDPNDPIDVHLDFEHPERSRIVVHRAAPPAEG